MSTTNKLTSGEYRILKLIIESDYQDECAGDPELFIDNPVWQVTVTKEDRGYMSSCVKKGYAGVWNGDPKDATCWITREGYNAYKEYELNK